MHTANAQTSAATIYGYEILITVGAGLTFLVGYSVAACVVPRGQVQNVIGFINVSQIGSTAIACCIYQNLGVKKLEYALAGYGLSRMEIGGALGGVAASGIGANQAISTHISDAIIATIGDICIQVVVAGAITLLSGLVMKTVKIKMEMVAGG